MYINESYISNKYILCEKGMIRYSDMAWRISPMPYSVAAKYTGYRNLERLPGKF